MANLYSKYSLQYLTANDVASLLFGRAAPAQVNKVQVRPAINDFFQSSVQTEPDAISQPVWVFGGGVSGLGSLGHLGEGGTPSGIKGVDFSNNGAAQAFLGAYGTSGGCDAREGAWSPLSQGQVSAINSRLERLEEAADLNPKAEEILQRWKATARSRVKAVDDLERHDVWAGIPCGRSDQRERSFRGAMKALKAHLLGATSLPIPAPPPIPVDYIPPPTATVEQIVQDVQPSYPPTSSGTRGTSSRSQGLTSSGPQKPVSEGLPKWAIPVSIGAVVLLAAGGLFLAKRK